MKALLLGGLALSGTLLAQLLLSVVANDLDRNSRAVSMTVLRRACLMIAARERGRWLAEWSNELDACSETGVRPLVFTSGIVFRALPVIALRSRRWRLEIFAFMVAPVIAVSSMLMLLFGTDSRGLVVAPAAIVVAALLMHRIFRKQAQTPGLYLFIPGWLSLVLLLAAGCFGLPILAITGSETALVLITLVASIPAVASMALGLLCLAVETAEQQSARDQASNRE